MSDISREELDRLYQTLDQGFSGIHARLDLLNSRTQKAEQAIAIIQDRASRAKGTAATWGGSIGAIGVVVAEAVKWLWTR